MGMWYEELYFNVDGNVFSEYSIHKLTKRELNKLAKRVGVKSPTSLKLNELKRATRNKLKEDFKHDFGHKKPEITSEKELSKLINFEVYVAVYGTLKVGKGNHRVLGESELVTTGFIKGYVMYSNGYYPSIFKVDDEHQKVYVEVYKVTDIDVYQNLLSLEGFPMHYGINQVEVNGIKSLVFVNGSTNYTNKIENGIF